MKKLLLAVAIAGVVLGTIPGHAEVKSISSKHLTFSAPPCGILVCDEGVESNGYQAACGSALIPPWGNADYAVKVPKGANYMIFTAKPETDWNLYVCQGTKTRRFSNRSYINAFNIRETIGMFVKPGTRYTLRAFNIMDASDLIADLSFKYLKAHKH